MRMRRPTLRVLLVCEPGRDGAFRHVEGLACHLLERAIHVDLAYSSVRGSDDLARLVEHVRCHGGDAVDLKVSSMPGPADVAALARLRGLAQRTRPHIVHAHSSKAGALVRLLRRLGGLEGAGIVYTPHAYYGMGDQRSRKAIVFDAVERRLGSIGLTIAISRDEADYATGRLALDRERVRTVHNPVDLGLFEAGTAEERARLRAGFGLPDGAVVIGTIARMAPQKDPVTLYRALGPFLRRHEDAWLCHVGEGELAPELDAAAAEFGFAERRVVVPSVEDAAEVYRCLDLFAITPAYEAGWPLVVLEAMAAGLPLVVGDAPGLSSLAGAGLSHCWTAPRGDHRGLEAALESWWIDRALARPSNHRVQASSRFDPARRFDDVIDIYTSSLWAS